MNSRYKIIISNQNLYKEVELTPEYNQYKIGTGVDCEARLHKNLFFGPIELLFTKNNAQWSVFCSDNLYLSVGDVRKLMNISLRNGDIIDVKYQDSDITAFTIEFLIDFDNGKVKYERILDVASLSSISIGANAGGNIVLASPFIKNDTITLLKKGEGYQLKIGYSQYGVYHNGKKALGDEIIKNGDFFSLSDYFFYYKDGKIWTQIRDDMGLNSVTYKDCPEQNSYPKFNRNTRIKSIINDEKIEILDPSAKPQKPKNGSLITKLLPSLTMVMSSIMMAFVNPAMIVVSLFSVVVSILTVILNRSEGKKDYEHSLKERIDTYNAYIAQKRKDIEKCRAEEHKVREEIYVSQDVERQRFGIFSSDLFDRRPTDDDFLCVRLGNGLVEATREINYKKQEKLEVGDDLQQMPEKLSEEYKYIKNAPIVCDLKEANAIGVVGDKYERFEIMKNLIVDIAARQYFSDVKMIFVAENRHAKNVRWLRMLPHAYSEEIGSRLIVTDDESKNLVFEYLYKELSYRKQEKKFDNRIVVFFHDEYGFQNHPISRFVDEAKDLGVIFVFFGNTKADVPMGCSYIIDIQGNNTAALVHTEDRSKTQVFTYPKIDNASAADIVRILAPVYTEEISLEGSLTKNISLFELLNILAVDDIDLDKRWSTSKVFKSMAAPLGVSKTSTVYLDLHDKAHGPHGLVAGTTGSGKSEILQTYILSMATLFHPYEVGFVIIDFKGGGMANQFRDLPHMMGAITNIDGKEINRSLKSIKAELQKRQRLFAEADVNHIDKYIKKYKAGETKTPLPHLIIVVDEFAELKAEQPEFMKELISAARIGRSLGVHLILATQKPAGQVNEQIWSNSRFKLCLKVQSQEDSNEVIKSPLAAEIKEPGRAYLQVGNNEIFELFQSAYSGASEKADESKVKEFAIFQMTDSSKRVPVYVQKKDKTDGGSTQLDAIVEYVHNHFESKQIKKLPDICLPSLSTCIDFVDHERADNGKIEVEIGVYDDPDNQYQGTYKIDVGNQNVMLIGSAQSGKTNILQNIIRSLSTKYTPDEVSIYIIDFASMVLKNFEKLNHVGGVVTSSEDEKLKNLFKLINTEIAQRKEKLLSVGVSSFSAYREAGRTDLPQIVLMIDNLTALKELYFQDDDELLAICREGLSVGISIIIANSQTQGIGYKYLSNFSTRIALFCNDSNEYSSLFDHCSERIDDIHGRCIVEIDKTHLDCQAYLAFKGEKEIDRVKEIKEFIAQTNSKYKKSFAKMIPVIPEMLTESFVRENLTGYMQDGFSVVAGLDYACVSPFVLDLANMGGPLTVTGRDGSGKHNFIKYLVNSLEEYYADKTEVHIIDGINKKLMPLKANANVVSYEVMPEKSADAIKTIEEELQSRYSRLASGEDSVLEESKLLVLIVNNADAMQYISTNMSVMDAYKNIVGKYKNMNVCVIFGGYENTNISYSSPELIKSLRDARRFMYFDDISNMKIIDLPLAVMRAFKKPIDLGDCYYIKDNDCLKIKSVLTQQS